MADVANQSTEDQVEDPSIRAMDNEELYKTWSTEIFAALKREKKFRADGNRVVKLYEAKSPETTPFAILYSNTETLVPAIYNTPPVPIVARRFKDADPLGKMASEAGTRILKFLLDASSENFDFYDELISAAVLNALVPGRGLTRWKYVANDDLSYECVFGEDIRWDKFFHGYARTWKKVPWIGFEWDMTKGEVRKNFGDTIANAMKYGSAVDSIDSDEPGSRNNEREEVQGVSQAKVYEIWNKTDRRVYFISPNYQKGAVKVVDDPLKLEAFFPVAKPISFFKKISTMVPTALYIQYENQAKELNDITTRLRKLINALKIRGFYNSTVEGIEKVLNAEENTLVPVENMQSMPENAKPDSLIWLMPVGEIATVVQSLYQEREQCKQVIYEITGISDILRGASVASETATAQNIKNQWGTLRLKRMQKEVQRYCRDSLAIMLEIAANQFSPKTVSAMTGLPYPMQQAKASAQMQIGSIQQHSQMQTQMAAVQAQQSGQPAPPPQPPQIPPELQHLASTPSWEEVLALLKDNAQRDFRIDIETNSTIDPEATQDKQDISDLLNAIGQFLNGVAPLIQDGSMPFEVAKSLMLVIARRYTFGSEIEDSLSSMQPPQPQGQGPEVAAQQQADQMKAQADMADHQARMQMTQQKMQQSAKEFEQKQVLMATELQIEQEKAQLALLEVQNARELAGMQMTQAQHKHNLSIEAMNAKAAAAKAKPNGSTPAGNA